jgi:bacterioferritin (cytochrome b1)
MNNLIENLNSDLTNEISHMNFYIHASIVVEGLHRNHFVDFFTSQAKSEMDHVKAFSNLIQGLGGELKLNFNSNYKISSHNPKDLIEEAIRLERSVIDNYYQRIKEAEEYDNPDGRWIVIFLEEQLEHSRTDLDNMVKMIKE